jgi:hypothetical protein
LFIVQNFKIHNPHPFSILSQHPTGQQKNRTAGDVRRQYRNSDIDRPDNPNEKPKKKKKTVDVNGPYRNSDIDRPDNPKEKPKKKKKTVDVNGPYRNTNVDRLLRTHGLPVTKMNTRSKDIDFQATEQEPLDLSVRSRSPQIKVDRFDIDTK